MAVAYMISAKRRAIEVVASMDIPYSDICLNTPHFSRFAAPRKWYGWVLHLEGASKVP